VKLLDAQERLPVHVHPGRGFAQRHLGCRSGKTEAWVIIAAEGSEARVHLGFTRDIEAAELDGWMKQQDGAALLGSLHALDVQPGDAVLVPAGLPHAIGGGIFCVEVQEPTDFSVMLEWAGFAGLDPRQARLGLDADLARECVQRKALSSAGLEHLRRAAAVPRNGVERLFPDDADGFFRAERIRSATADVELDAGFAILIVLEGQGQLETAAGDSLVVRRGSTILIPHAAGTTTLSGAVAAVRCRPPSVAAALAAGLGAAPGAAPAEEA
jgi:mannose-6-phosphate isomerase